MSDSKKSAKYSGTNLRTYEKTMHDKLNELKKKGVQFVKYQFTDMQGNIREVTLTIGEINGIGTTSVDGSSVFGKIIPHRK